MRTVSEEETLEIAKIIQEIGEKMYSKNGAKFVAEAKKFLNEEPCWVEKEPIHPFFGAERICIIGSSHEGLHALHLLGRRSVGEVMLLHEAPYLLEQLSEIPFIANRLSKEFDEEAVRICLKEKLSVDFLGDNFGKSENFLIKSQNKLRAQHHNTKASKAYVQPRPKVNRKK